MIFVSASTAAFFAGSLQRPLSRVLMNVGSRGANQYRRARRCPVSSSGTLGFLMLVSQVSKETRSELVGSRPTVIVIDNRLLVRTCVVKALQSAMLDLEVLGVSSVSESSTAPARHVLLIALHIATRTMDEPVLRALTQLQHAFPATPLALISDCEDAPLGSEALRHGVKGYLTTSTPLEVTVAAIRLLLAGGVYCAQPVGERHDRTASAKQPEKSESSRAGSNARGHSPNGMEPDQPVKCSAAFAELSSWGITAREAEVLSELQRGCSNKLIARALNLSENTVKMHLRHIMCKLHVRNRTEAVLLSQKHLYEKTERNSQKRAGSTS
jgi:DNA-binding NarL/FixJ family response regulator